MAFERVVSKHHRIQMSPNLTICSNLGGEREMGCVFDTGIKLIIYYLFHKFINLGFTLFVPQTIFWDQHLVGNKRTNRQKLWQHLQESNFEADDKEEKTLSKGKTSVKLAKNIARQWVCVWTWQPLDLDSDYAIGNVSVDRDIAYNLHNMFAYKFIFSYK